jgi:hypothetical protein
MPWLKVLEPHIPKYFAQVDERQHDR